MSRCPYLKSTIRCLVVALAAATVAGCAHSTPPPKTFSAERAFLEDSLRRDPIANPKLIFLLMGQYSSANQQRRGLGFLEERLDEHVMPEPIRALYLAAIGALRAQCAGEIPLLQRIAWVDKALEELDESVAITKSEMYIVRWLRAVVMAQLPDMFDRRDQALAELQWAEAHIREAPAGGLLRELLFAQALLYQRMDEREKADHYLRRSGYSSFERPIGLTTPFVLDRETGFAFDAKRIVEAVPGRVFQATGYDFMEYYFVLSKDGSALFCIDAGSRDDSMATVLADLRAAYPALPPVKAVFVTHAHWDHIGGQRHLRALESTPTFYASANWDHQLEEQENTGGPYEMWWGTRFELEAVTSFRPDIEIAERRTITLGGSDVELIPIRGGETQDALLIHLPEEKVVFGGDFIMPYLGAPFSQEGSASGLVEALEQVRELAPIAVLHGHAGINGLFPTTETLVGMVHPLTWLEKQVRALLAQGVSRAEIHHRNLIPADLLAGRPELDIPYLVIREHLINRVADQKRGYWQVGYRGTDSLTDGELGSILVHYADLDPDKRLDMVEAMVAAGDHELALRTLRWLRPHHQGSKRYEKLRRRTHLKLVEQEQVLDAFKFIWYSGGIEFEAAAPTQMETPTHAAQEIR